MKFYAPFMQQARKFVGRNGAPLAANNGMIEITDPADLLALLNQGWDFSTMPEHRRTVASNNANCTLAANALAFGKHIYIVVSGAAAITCTTEDANNVRAVLPAPKLWDTWFVRVINTNSGNLTLAAGNGIAFNGTVVVAANRFIDFMAMVVDLDTASNNQICYYNIGMGNAT